MVGADARGTERAGAVDTTGLGVDAPLDEAAVDAQGVGLAPPVFFAPAAADNVGKMFGDPAVPQLAARPTPDLADWAVELLSLRTRLPP